MSRCDPNLPYTDAFGRVSTITEVTTEGDFNTTYLYDVLGNVTNVIDHAANQTRLSYDSWGRKTSMIDPDMGAWSYGYDNADRLEWQIDARTNKVTFEYNDQLGRMTSKHVYNRNNQLVGTTTYTYDTSDDPAYSVFKGQLYKVTDQQGYQKNAYDVRDRLVKSARFLNINAMEYVTQTTFDDADRVQTLVYPKNAAKLQYSYDTAGNLSQIKSLAGTGTQEIFYTAGGFNELGQITDYTYGNGVASVNDFFPISRRVQRLRASMGETRHLDLSYTYTANANLSNRVDGVYSGAASATVTDVTYDSLNRMVSLNSVARGARAYSYSAIGNIIVNQDNGAGQYSYGAKPHAVVSANGKSYGYDACGNMTTRGSQTLIYDEENQLVQAGGVKFGYADGGTRLWRSGTNGYAIWINDIYEISNGKVLCHVMAGGQRIASFEPICGGPWAKVIGEERWFAASMSVQSLMTWPFEEGRAPLTVLLGTFAGILGLCLVSRRRYGYPPVRNWRRWWQQSVTFVSIAAFVMATTQNVEAQTYSPVFYYYHCDHLGSSSVLTDRSGERVQHYGYSAFGDQTHVDNTLAFPVSHRFTGQILDEETGLYYYNSRYYDPELGRFIQPDSIIPDPYNPQSFNRYSYVENNPLNAVDPTGHQAAAFASPAVPVVVPFMPGTFYFGTDNNRRLWIGYNNGEGGFSMEFGNGDTVTLDVWNRVQGYMIDDAYYPATEEHTLATFPVPTSNPSEVPAIVSIPSQSSAPPQTSASVSAPPATGGGSVLATITNAAGWLSMIPGPIGTIAGIANGIGEAMQGHWGAAAIGLGGAILALGGLGVVTGLAKAGKAAKGGVVFRELSVADRIRLNSGLGLLPKGTAGNIADQVAGKATKYISASETAAGTALYKGGNGLVAIDVNLALKQARIERGVAARPGGLDFGAELS